MRKVIGIFLLLLYSLTSFGVNATFHFCGNKLASIQFIGNSKPNDCCKGRPAKRKCCHNTHFKIKSTKSDQRVSIIKFNDKPIENSLFIDTRPLESSFIQQNVTFNFYRFPNLNYKVPLYIQNRVLII